MLITSRNINYILISYYILYFQRLNISVIHLILLRLHKRVLSMLYVCDAPLIPTRTLFSTVYNSHDLFCLKQQLQFFFQKNIIILVRI